MHSFIAVASTILLAGLRVGEIVARVNGQEISGAAYTEQILQRFGRVALTEMIEERLLDQEARTAKLVVDQKELDKRVRVEAEGFKRTANRLPNLAEIEILERWVRRAYLVELLSVKRTQIPESEIAAYYTNHKTFFVEPEQIRVSDIVLDTRENAVQIRTLLVKGGDFAGLARRFSQDAASREQGGDLGWLPVQSLALPLKQAALKLKAGAVSDPIELAGDWHMLKVTGRKPERQQTLAEVRTAIHQRLYQERLPMARASLILQLRERAEKLLPDEFRNRP